MDGYGSLLPTASAPRRPLGSRQAAQSGLKVAFSLPLFSWEAYFSL